MIFSLRYLVTIILLSLSCSLYATENDVSIKYDPIINSSSIIQIIFVLILILILIYSIFWILKKKYPSQLFSDSNGRIRVVSSLTVGPREKIFLIEVADKQFLLSGTPNNINLIKSFDEKILDVDESSRNRSFANLLLKYKNNS
jgi:flagellar protein FliO/FliZ